MQEKMRLTARMLIELRTINRRVDHISREIVYPILFKCQFPPISSEMIENTQAVIAELNGYKTRCENILCETDIKEKAHEDLLQS